ncbi:hypothetical protein BDF22DRAFT_236993 [Syncephalis plumigaleata]|nr:hypothetical protein BDF22DRAFT_236993 [Syncephalis plumigaleata]
MGANSGLTHWYCGILTRIAYFFKRNVDCSVGRYLISICQGLSYCGFITVITWCQQHGYGKCGITFIFQLLTGILTVVAVVISPIPIREQYTVAGICMYPAVASVYPNLVAAGFIGYALMMLANVINAFYYLPPEIDDGSEIDDGELPEATPRDTTRTRLARLLRLSRRRSTRKQRRRLIHRYRRRASSLGGEVNARGARMGYVRRTTNSEGPSSFSDVNSWFSYPRSNGSTRSSNRPAALRDGSGDSAAPWVIPVCSVAHIIPDPLRWISIDEAHTRISPSMLLRTFTRHSVLFTDVMAGLCMIIIGITYITDVWQRLTNMPIVISWIAICYASLNSLRYWHRRDVRLALLYPIPRMDQSREQVHILTDNGTHSFYQSPVEEVDTTDITDTTATTATTGSGGSTNNDDDNKRSGAPSILEIPAALSGPVAPPRQLSESSEAHTIDMSHLDGQPGNANLFVKTIGAVSESPTLSIETFGPIHHVNDAEDVDAAIDAAIDGDSIITSHSTDTE